MKIKIPGTVREMKISQLSKWAKLVREVDDLENLVNNWDFKIEVVSIFSGETKQLLGRIEAKVLSKIFRDIMETLGKFESSEPSKSITIDGQDYVFKKDFKRVTTNQIIDLKSVEDLDLYPERGLSYCYLQKGYKYGALNEDGAIAYPSADRQKIFNDHFPGDEFLNWLGFFLNKYAGQKIAISVLNLVRTTTTLQEVQEELALEVKTMKPTKRARPKPPTG